MRALIGKRIRLNGGKRKLGSPGGSRSLRRAEQAELQAIEKLIERKGEGESQDAFMRAVRPLLRRLGNYTRRRLRALEANGKLDPGQVVFADLLDEILRRASLLYPDRPRWLELDLWLTNLADEILKEQTLQSSQNLISIAR